MSDMPSGLRERKKRKTRAAIEEAALGLFARQGFETTTVEEIADAVDISPRTFFRYFPAKEDVVFAHSADTLGRLIDQLRGQPPRDAPFETVRDALLAVAESFEHHRDAELARARLIVSNPALRARALQMQDEWADAIADAMAANAGLPEPDVRLRILATVGVAANRVAFDQWRDARGSTPLPQFVEHAFELLIADVGHCPQAAEGRARRDGTRAANT